MTTPEFPGPTPQLVVHDAARAIEFYRRALGADELLRHHTADGRVMHSELLVGGGRLFVIDDIEADSATSSPDRLRGTTSRMHLYVADVEQAFARFVDAGGVSTTAPADTFWGDRYAEGRDPFGHLWSFAVTLEDLSPDEMHRRAERA